MKFGSILKNIGVGLLSSNPVGASILGAVNMFMPDDKKLPDGSTGEQVKAAVDSLPPEQKASLMEKEIELEMEQEKGWTERYKVMSEADGQSTRPQIALMMAKVFAAQLLMFMVILAYAVTTEGMSVLNQPYLWTVFAALTATPAGILGKYFGELRKEQGNRLAATGEVKDENKASLTKIIGSIWKK